MTSPTRIGVLERLERSHFIGCSSIEDDGSGCDCEAGTLVRLARVADEVCRYLDEGRDVPTIQKYNLEKALERLGL